MVLVIPRNRMQLLGEMKLFLIIPFLVATLRVCLANSQQELQVSIDVNYSAPGGFHLKPPNYRAASSLTLSCKVKGLQEAMTYNWTTDCIGGSFTQGKATESVEKLAMQSTDSGFHTCTVTDASGHIGNATVEAQVTGAGIYVHSGYQVLPNNAIISAIAVNRIPGFTCLSGSKRGNVGRLIGVTGRDITFSHGDQFTVVRGNTNNPGSVQVYVSQSGISPEDEGIYTCRIPDERGRLIDANVGLYLQHSRALPIITSLEISGNATPFALTCTSTGSPPTNIVWKKNGSIIAIDGSVFKLTQTILDRKSSTYESVLTIDTQYGELLGVFTCTIYNSFGVSETESIILEAVEIRGHEHPLIVGLDPVINCSTRLQVTKSEWFLEPFEVALESSTDQEVSLPLDLTLGGFDGAMFKCRVTSQADGVYEKTITVTVKELENIVAVKAPSMPLLAGESYTITCSVYSDIFPQVQWMGPDGSVLIGNSDINIGDLVVLENGTVTVSLQFTSLRTSQAGQYTCQSVVYNPPSVETGSVNVIVQASSPTVSIQRSSSSSILYTASQLVLKCLIQVNSVVDTGFRVSTTWSGPRGNNNRFTVSDPVFMHGQYSSILKMNYLQSSDTGTYTCRASVSPDPASAFIHESEVISKRETIDVDLNVTITIQYNPPSGVTLRPPNYRPATSVSLRCDAVGTTGYVTYHWSSTCGSGCFVSGSYHTVSRSYLFSHDAGNHTCVVTDGAGNTGTATTEMNVIGAGMYASSSQYSNSVPLSNNSAIVWTSYYSYTHYRLYCMSNASSTSAYVVYPYSSGYTSTSSCGTGCYQLYYSRTSRSLSSSYQGIHTCMIQDSRGIYLDVNVGIYPNGFYYAPVITLLERNSSSQFTITCISTTSPATTVIWMKDGNNLTMDGAPYQLTQVLTNRRSSIYNNILTSTGHHDTVAGLYTCTVQNRFGSSTESIEIQGFSVSGDGNPTIGEEITFTCTTDLDLSETTIEWYEQHHSGMTTLVTSVGEAATLNLGVATVDKHGSQYTCRATGPFGVQERNVTIDIQIPNEWSTVTVDASPTEVLAEGYDYTLSCIVSFENIDLQAKPKIVWLGPEGLPVQNGSNVTVGRALTIGNVTRLSLHFSPLSSTHGGEYICSVSVHVPYINVTLSKEVTTFLVVESQALFQLKFGPVQHCLEWDENKPWQIDNVIRNVLTDAINNRCNCGFERNSIYDGEFSCRGEKEKAMYWSKINGTSDKHTATGLLAFMQDWIDKDGKFTVNTLRMEVSKTCSPLRLQSFHQAECSDETKTSARGTGAPQSYIDKCVSEWLESECTSMRSAHNGTDYS